MRLAIRPARLEDVPALRAILEEHALTLDGVAYDDFSGLVLVAERAGEVVGFAQAIPAKPYSILTELSVARAHQHRGYGVRLLEHLETVLRVLGYGTWVTYSGQGHPDVHALLDHYGARCTGAGAGFVRVP